MDTKDDLSVMGKYREAYRAVLEEQLPKILFRSDPRFQDLTGLSPGHLKNMDSAGTGPGGKIKIGKKVGYLKDGLIPWLVANMRE